MQDAYFLYHSIGQYPGKDTDLAAAMSDFARVWAAADDRQWGYILTLRQAFIDRWRAIIGAPQGTVTTCESVTHGLHMLATAIPHRLKGRRVLVAADCFPSNHFLLAELARRHGFTLDTVPLRQGTAHVESEDFAARWGPDVALALLTWVSSTTSHRIDLPALVAHGRSMGSLIGVDITQAAGLIPFDVMDPQVDFTLSTSLKWMCGTPGAGILHVCESLIAEANPELRGWFSQPDPFSWALDRFTLAPDIRRFDSGTPGCMAALASLPALDWHAAQDHAALLGHNRRLAARIIALADDAGLDLVTPRDEHRRGGSVMVRLPERLPAPALLDRLRGAGIAADARGQTLRLSPGAVTAEGGVDLLAEVLAKAVA